MGTELNLTDDQRRRIEDAKSAEEKVAIIMEAADAGMELSDEQLEGVSVGVRIPPTHEEIDRTWDTIQSIYDTYGQDVAAIAAFDLGLIPLVGSSGSGNYFTGRRSIPEVRNWMHRELEGKNDSYSSAYGL